MTEAEVREYMYENNVRGDLSIESMANDIGTSQGEWMWNERFGMKRCSVCGGMPPFYIMASAYYESKYCPHCGSRMLKGTGDERGANQSGA